MLLFSCSNHSLLLLLVVAVVQNLIALVSETPNLPLHDICAFLGIEPQHPLRGRSRIHYVHLILPRCNRSLSFQHHSNLLTASPMPHSEIWPSRRPPGGNSAVPGSRHSDDSTSGAIPLRCVCQKAKHSIHRWDVISTSGPFALRFRRQVGPTFREWRSDATACADH